MSGWPWMKGEPVVLADPIPIIDPTNKSNKDIPNNGNCYHDKRPSVKQLIHDHRDPIDQLKRRLATHAYYDPSKHDDLWLLRFLLSHKNHVKRAHRAAASTLEYRHVHRLDERDRRWVPPQYVLEECRDPNFVVDESLPLWNGARRFWKNGHVSKESINLQLPHETNHNHNHHTKQPPLHYGTIFFFHIASLDTHQLATVDDADWLAANAFLNEFSFQWLDYITRTTGRLTKAVHLVDVKGIAWHLYNLHTQTKYTRAASHLQDCYPQAVQQYVVCHAPEWIQFPWKVLRPLLPRRVVSKLDFMQPSQCEADRQRLLTYVPHELLPVRFGGTYEPWPPRFGLPDIQHDDNGKDHPAAAVSTRSILHGDPQHLYSTTLVSSKTLLHGTLDSFCRPTTVDATTTTSDIS